jgi:hypothetical protein
MSRDEDYKYSDAFIIGDESAASTVMLRTQAEIQAGLGKHFSQLQTIVNREWFGSSLHEPCLQMADWLAFLVRVWAEGSGTYSNDIKRVLPSFRGYPDKVLGSGIICVPIEAASPICLKSLGMNTLSNSKHLITRSIIQSQSPLTSKSQQWSLSP